MAAAPTVVWMPGGVRTEIHLSGADTDGAFCLLVDHPPPGWSLPAHLHRGTAETIHVVEGEFELLVAGLPFRVSAGETLRVPPDTVHSGANVGATRGRRVLVFSPAGMESFFLEAGARSEGEVSSPAAMLAAAQRHGWEFIGVAGARARPGER
jgi:quercetin dioxygenase-like cupin family protein